MSNIEDMSFDELQNYQQDRLAKIQAEFAKKHNIPGNDCPYCMGAGKIVKGYSIEICGWCQRCKDCGGELNGRSTSVLCLECTIKTRKSAAPAPIVKEQVKEQVKKYIPNGRRESQKAADDAARNEFAKYLNSKEGKKAREKKEEIACEPITQAVPVSFGSIIQCEQSPWIIDPSSKELIRNDGTHKGCVNGRIINSSNNRACMGCNPNGKGTGKFC